MKKAFFVLPVLVLLILACGGTSPATPSAPQVDNIPTIVAATFQALTANAPPPQPSGIPVTFQNVSFVIPTGLASGANTQTVAAVTDQNGPWWELAPEHINFTLNNYNLPPGYFSTIQISVYPVQGYDTAAKNITLLQAILANPASLNPANLPFVPFFNAAQMFAAQVQVIPFKSGSGVRMVTQYGQAAGPVTNNGTFYHFQGLTSDGKYYIIAILPVEAPFFETPNVPTPADAVPFPGYTSLDPADYNTYFQAVTKKLNATSADTFLPSLNSLDALIKSITVISQ